MPTHQVNLGLDLRGGTHLLLEVDTASSIAAPGGPSCVIPTSRQRRA
ncbi:hypothetical protein [Ferrovibrio sp.]